MRYESSCTVKAALLAAAMLLANGRTVSATLVQQPLGVTGFTADTIVDAADSPAPYSGPPASFPNGFEKSSTGTLMSGIDNAAATGFGDLYFQNGLFGDTNGVPANGVVSSLATNVAGGNTVFNLGYNGTTNDLSSDNSLRFLTTSGAGSSQTLSLTSPGKFATLDFLATAQTHGSTFDVTLNFDGGGSDVYTGVINTGDWAFSSYPANTALKMADVYQIANTNTFGGWNGGMYENDITLSPADQALTVDSVTFTATNLAGGASSEIFAISGQAIVSVPEPASIGLLALVGIGFLGRRSRKV